MRLTCGPTLLASLWALAFPWITESMFVDTRGRLFSGLRYGPNSYRHIIVQELGTGGEAPPPAQLRCFQIQLPYSRLDANVVKERFRTADAAECEKMCLASTKYTCRGFNYRRLIDVMNCELTDADTNQLDSPTTIAVFQAEKSDVYVRSSSEGQCSMVEDFFMDAHSDVCFEMFMRSRGLSLNVVNMELKVKHLHECESACLELRSCQTIAYRDDGNSFTSLPNCYLSPYAAKSLMRADFVNGERFDIFRRVCPKDPEEREEVFFSVNGEPCITSPRQFATLGFYYCEVDDKRRWNYCCEPTEKCDPDTRICSVGPRLDQWRPCTPTNEELRLNIL